MFQLLCFAAAAAAAPADGGGGNGTYTLGPDYRVDPVLVNASAHAARGAYYRFELPLNRSRYYDCTAATRSLPFDGNACLPTRSVAVYVPAQYADGDEAGVLVQQDGPGLDTLLIAAMDALIGHADPARALPTFVAVSVSTGTTSDGTGSLRDNQYDTVSGKYAAFVDDEVLGAVRAHPQIRADYPRLRLTADPQGRLALGCSSGGAAALSMAWFRPDLFARVVAYSPTLVLKDTCLPSNATHPLGAWEYPAMIRAAAQPPRKPLRIFHSVTNRDIGTTGDAPYPACNVTFAPGGSKAPLSESVVMNATEGCFVWPGVCAGTPAADRLLFHDTMDPLHSNWEVANNNTAAALAEMGYATRYAKAKGRCHCDLDIFLQDLPSTLVWAWHGWRPTKS